MINIMIRLNKAKRFPNLSLPMPRQQDLVTAKKSFPIEDLHPLWSDYPYDTLSLRMHHGNMAGSLIRHHLVHFLLICESSYLFLCHMNV